MLTPNYNCKRSPNIPSKLIVLFFQQTVSQHEQARDDDDVGEQDDDGDDDVGEQVPRVLGRRSVLQGSESQRFTNI